MPQNASSRFLDDLRHGLRDLGYVEDKNLQLEIRWGEGKLERLTALADELVGLHVDVIVSQFTVHQSSQVSCANDSIFMPLSSDPVGDGLVASLARPGGNITSLSMMSPELGVKRMQMLKETFPKLSRPVAVLWKNRPIFRSSNPPRSNW
jgi:putative tryptophan/tyrosine transport system substrate-binding protein